MTIKTVNLLTLKQVKNSVIGNPSAKLAKAQDISFVQTLVECLNRPPPPSEAQGSQDDIRIEAAHVISSLSYGSQEALRSLLRADAPREFLFAMSKFQPSDSIALRSAFARALRALSVAIADTVGPSQWGLHVNASDIRNEVKIPLDYLFQLESLDIYLPLLVDTSPQTSTSIAQLLASAVRNQAHRSAITDWLPPADRMKEVKGKRGWEKPDMSNLNAPSRHGGWVARNLTGLLRSRDVKAKPPLQEAALSALAALAKDNSAVATILAKHTPDREVPSPLSSVLSLCKSRSTDVQLAACLCSTHILRSGSMPIQTSAALPIIHVTSRMITSPSESTHNRTKACFILNYLIADHDILCRVALERGAAEKLATLVKSITKTENQAEWDEDEPENISCLREAALTAIASLSLFDNEIRREVTDSLRLIPIIHVSLSHRHVGVRFAACQCVRALSRAVAVIRTNIMDSGLGMSLFGIFKKEGEDRRVTYAALSAMCNLVNEFSPLRPIFLEQGVMPRLLQLLDSDDVALRLSALWAIKNLLYKSSTELKRDVMNHLGWRDLAELLADPDSGVQEQALNVVQNIAENEPGIDMVFQGLGPEVILSHLTVSLVSPDGAVVLQAARALANLANGTEVHQNLILSHPSILLSLRSCLADAQVQARRPAVGCVLELARTNPKRREELIDAGILSTLRHICEWTGGVSPGGRSMSHIVEDDKEVLDSARAALAWLEHPGGVITEGDSTF